jgi:antitoxin HigA-1
MTTVLLFHLVLKILKSRDATDWTNKIKDNQQLTAMEVFELERLKNIHPGEILLEDFLKPLEVTAYRLSKDTDIPQTRISQIIKGRRSITADTALRLASYLGTTAKFWLGLQADYDLEEEREGMREILISIKKNAPQHAIWEKDGVRLDNRMKNVIK